MKTPPDPIEPLDPHLIREAFLSLPRLSPGRQEVARRLGMSDAEIDALWAVRWKPHAQGS